MSAGTGGLHARGGAAAGKVAFVLPGGATRGAGQVGMLQALTEHGIRPDFVVGTSVGAMNAASYAADATLGGLGHLAELWTVARRSQIFPFAPRAVAESLRERRGYLLPNDGLRDWIGTHVGHGRLEDFPIPVHAVAADVDSGAPVVLSHGDAVTALLASTAIPGVFPAVTIGGRSLCDGGVAADIPVPQAVALGAETIYVLPSASVDLASRLKPWPWLDLILGNPASDDPVAVHPDITLHWLPAPSFAGNPYSFRSSGRLIAEAYELARHHLDPSAVIDLREPRTEPSTSRGRGRCGSSGAGGAPQTAQPTAEAGGRGRGPPG